MFRHAALASVIALGPLLAGGAAAAETAEATLMDGDGDEIGQVVFTATPHGVHLLAEADGLPEGVHAFHIHETGLCEPEEGFTTSGGHYAPHGGNHGHMDAGGPHAGDFPNVHVQADGVLAVEYFNDRISLDPEADGTLFDEDGSAVVMHAGADDYRSQPSGDAGSRIACGVIERR